MDIGLVLSGGGARCFAQIGALAAFEDYGLKVGGLAANSSAAILGALYAAGLKPKKIFAIFKELDYSQFLDPNGVGGFLDHTGVERLLRPYVPKTFEELIMPYAVPTVDIQTAEQVVFTSGELIPVVCASNALPGLFVPVEHQGRFLMDGGILNNVPLDLIRPLVQGPAVVVDVRLSPTKRLALKQDSRSLWEKLTSSFSGSMPLTGEILMKAYTITQSRLIELHYAMHPPDLAVRPDLGDDFELQDFGRIDEGYDKGYQATMHALEHKGW